MGWLVTLTIYPPPMLMSNFSSLLKDIEPPFKATAVERTPQTLETITFLAQSLEEVKRLIACWKDYFRKHYPKVKLGKPRVTPFSGV